MLYNKLGSSGVEVSAVSFGAMRWPSAEACRDIINRGIDAGMNYVDTSTGYVGGKSEKWTAEAIKPRRDEIYYSDKFAFNKAPDADEIRKVIDNSLANTGLDYFDFWQLWGLQKMEVLEAALAKGGWLEGVRKAQDDGLITRGIGFTFHGPPEVFKAAIDTGEFVSATVSYNLIKRKEEEMIAYAGQRNVGIIIMNPLAGGVLGLARHESLEFLRDGHEGTSYGALRFLLANKNITTSIVGFRGTGEVDEAVEATEDADGLDENFRRDLMDKMDSAKLLEGDFCTGCGYCKDCPQGVRPDRFMKAMRDFAVYGVDQGRLGEWIYSRYPHSDIVGELKLCTACGKCEQQCPQHLKIIESIARGKKALGIE